MALTFSDKGGQRIQTVSGNSEGGLLLLRDLCHCFRVLGRRGIDERLLVGAVRDAGLDGGRRLADEDDRYARSAVHDLLDDGRELGRVAAFVGDGYGVNAKLLAHAVDLGGLDRLDLLGRGVARFGGLDRDRERRWD